MPYVRRLPASVQSHHDIVALPVETTVAEARRALLAAGHSRLPIYRESLDNVVGILHSRDLFRAWEDQVENESVSPYLRAPSFVPESLSASSLLAEMRQTTHLSIVVDEYGGTAGLVTLEDLLEEIVGEIRDEFDREELQTIRQTLDGGYQALGRVKVLDFNRETGWDVPAEKGDSLGGLVFNTLGHAPKQGDVVQLPGFEISVVGVSGSRITRVNIVRRERRDQELRAEG